MQTISESARKTSLVYALAALSLGVTNSLAQEFAFTEIPSDFTSPYLSAGSHGLGGLCLAREVMPDKSVCHPSLLAEVEQSRLLARIYVGNGYDAFDTTQQLLFKPLTSNFLNTLFRQKNLTKLDMNPSLVFTTHFFSAEFSPYRIQYLSEIHNPNFPVISIHAARERLLALSSGIGLGLINSSLDDFNIGVRLRFLERTYIHSSFSLAEVLSEEPGKIVPVKYQYAIHADPALSWNIPEWKGWNGHLALLLTNVGYTWNEDELYDNSLGMSLGYGIKRTLPYGILRFGVDAVDVFKSQDAIDIPRVGLSYELGLMEVMIGWNHHTLTSGIQFGLKFIQAGIVYEFYRTEFDSSFQNRISTEIGVYL